MPLQKMGKLLNTNEIGAMSHLMNFKNRMRQRCSQDGLRVLSDSKWSSFCVPEFYVAKDALNIAEFKATRTYGEDFFSAIQKQDALVKKMQDFPA